jgi:hypothetical protein
MAPSPTVICFKPFADRLVGLGVGATWCVAVEPTNLKEEG